MTAREFTPRPYQPLIIDHILATPRCAVWAGMGVGKTPATLAALNDLLLLEGGPVLIVAPLRVARTVWPDEVRKWSTFSHMRVSVITGSVAERERALRVQADIYTTNFESLPWLVELLGERWPFQIVVVDESTKLKGFRLRQGTARAKALGRVAHTKIKRIIELTGTPSPNGLNDLWGQAWFLDKGERLGKTYDAFRQRWFEKSFDGYSISPKEFAQDQIQKALRDLCITIDAKDWFDLREPVVTNLYVDLPPAARALYEDMEKRMFMEIEEHQVEAFGAAARTVKCIAEGTEILTSNGWKPIEQWRPNDMLWDGEEWVNARNLVCNGHMPVVKCLQVAMTADHKVLTTAGWKTAEEINNANAPRGFDRAPVRLPDGYTSGRYDRKYNSKTGYLDGAMRMWQRIYRHRPESAQSKSGREEVLRVPPRGNAAGCLGYARDDGASGLGYLAQHEVPLRQHKGQRLEKLRRQGYRGVRTLARIVRELLGRHGADLRPWTYAGAARQQRELHPGELHVGGSNSAGQQSPRKRVFGHPRWAHDGGASREALRREKVDAGATHPVGVVNRKSAHTARVYDLVNCGPRHRFTVRGADGKLLIVHNCLQLANGAVYVGENTREWRSVHDAKLQVLEEIVEEAAGMPVLVAYNFKSDLERLQKAFPDGIWLSSDEGLRRAQRGEGRVWFGHPASMGHGVDGLQYHSNILAFFGHNWNLEERLQIIERIGPTRQMQAGMDRPTFIYNIIARDTVDEMVIERVDTKRQVQDILLDAMKTKGYR